LHAGPDRPPLASSQQQVEVLKDVVSGNLTDAARKEAAFGAGMLKDLALKENPLQQNVRKVAEILSGYQIPAAGDVVDKVAGEAIDARSYERGKAAAPVVEVAAQIAGALAGGAGGRGMAGRRVPPGNLPRGGPQQASPVQPLTRADLKAALLRGSKQAAANGQPTPAPQPSTGRPIAPQGGGNPFAGGPPPNLRPVAPQTPTGRPIVPQGGGSPFAGGPPPNLRPVAPRTPGQWVLKNESLGTGSAFQAQQVPGRSGQAYRVPYKNPKRGGKPHVDFDDYDPATNKLIDVKKSVVTSKKGLDQVLRQLDAAKQNGVAGIIWKVANKAQKLRAEAWFRRKGITGIEVIVP
jgi:hypothetical protein